MNSTKKWKCSREGRAEGLWAHSCAALAIPQQLLGVNEQPGSCLCGLGPPSAAHTAEELTWGRCWGHLQAQLGAQARSSCTFKFKIKREKFWSLFFSSTS